MSSWSSSSSCVYVPKIISDSVFCVFVYVCVFVNQTSRSPPARSRPPSRSIQQRCVSTGWWPRRFPRAPSWPAAPAAPAPSSAGCLWESKERESRLVTSQ